MDKISVVLRMFTTVRDEDREDFYASINRQNLARLKPIAVCALILEMMLLLRALYYLPGANNSVRVLTYVILYAIMVLMMALALVVLRIRRTDDSGENWAGYVIPLGIFVSLLWAAAISLMDLSAGSQQGTVLIAMQYLMMVVFMIPPALSFGAIFAVHALYIAGIFYFLPGYDVFSGVFINNLINAVLACVVSFVMYVGAYKQYRSNRLIHEKNELLSRLNAELAELSVTDPLTRIMNRRHFDITADQEWRRACRDGQRLTIAMADVDHFKQYNDMYGHQAGDECLRRVANAMGTELRRANDTLARFGGEEFIILMRSESAKKDERVITRVRQAVESLKVPHGNSVTNASVTISIGGCNFQPSQDDSIERMLRIADEALYEAKANGRNRVVFRTLANGE